MLHFNAVLLFLILLLSGPQEKPACKGIDLPEKALITQWLDERHVPLAGIGIIEQGKLASVRFITETGNKGIPSQNTFFNVASLTKPVVEMLTLKLVDMGKWNLDEPLANYWIDLDINSSPYLYDLTTRHVITHQSGFANWRSEEADKKLQFHFEPGTDRKYSGEGLEYLRRALEIKFGEGIDTLADSLIFSPLGMSNTGFYWSEKFDEKDFATPHNQKGEAYPLKKWYQANAADLLLSTVGDYTNFGAWVMEGMGLSDSLFREMITPQPAGDKGIYLPFGDRVSLGLGWMVIQDLPNDEYVLMHTGKDPGVNTIMMLLPASKRGIVIFTNGDNGKEIYTSIIKHSLDIGENIFQRLE
ncbi:serine hydrolase domain-containing protein [Negadavirga shengliensis]|uniref:Serine hydrolase domain-containing protein n=1 Tax=Negadavirga shengliensis TaxID=1389218 RepID=A0ABV9T527_9BACT